MEGALSHTRPNDNTAEQKQTALPAVEEGSGSRTVCDQAHLQRQSYPASLLSAVTMNLGKRIRTPALF